MSPAIGDEARRVSALAALVTLGVALVALVVRVVAVRGARELLAFPFPAHSLGLDGAWQVLQDNLTLAAVPLASAALLARARRTGVTSRRWRYARRALDLLLLVLVAGNVLVIGSSYGAYGWRMVRYTLPHGPVELAGFACVLTVYLDARQRSAETPRATRLAAGGLTLLAVGALLEGVLAPV